MASTKKRLRDRNEDLWLLPPDTRSAKEPATTSNRLCVPGGDTTTAPPFLPMDLLLEILTRSDAETIIRSAAVSRTLRGAVLSAGFRRLLTLRAADHGGYNPRLLRGISYRHEVFGTRRRDDRVAQALPPSTDHLIRFDATPIHYTPMSSRDGLVLLQHRRHRELSVCDSLTGDTTILPPMDITIHYPAVLLTVDTGRSSFEVLVADKLLRTQTYSSREGKWSGIVPPPSQVPNHGNNQLINTCHPVVIGRTVHWLCYHYVPAMYWSEVEAYILALDVDAARATVVELHRDTMTRMPAVRNLHAIMLVGTADGMLGLVVSETSAISMWTFSSAEWRRRVLLPLPNWGAYGTVEPSAFGERSGTVVLSMSKVGLVQLLNVASSTKEEQPVVVLRLDNQYRTTISQVCLHEINLDALLTSMRHYPSLPERADD